MIIEIDAGHLYLNVEKDVEILHLIIETDAEKDVGIFYPLIIEIDAGHIFFNGDKDVGILYLIIEIDAGHLYLNVEKDVKILHLIIETDAEKDVGIFYPLIIEIDAGHLLLNVEKRCWDLSTCLLMSRLSSVISPDY